MGAAAVVGIPDMDIWIESGRCRRGVRVRFDLLDLIDLNPGEQGAASSESRLQAAGLYLFLHRRYRSY